MIGTVRKNKYADLANHQNNLEVSIIIPIYNEESGICDTVNNLVKVLRVQKVNYELILVNNGSLDNTHSVLAKLTEENKEITVINFKENKGYGGGIIAGFEHAKGEYVGFTCADEEVSAEDVLKVYYSLRNSDVDVSKARRVNRKDGSFRKLTSFLFNILISLRFNLGLKDINGYPLFMKRALFQQVKTKETAYLFNLDLLRNMKKKDYKIIEVIIVHNRRKKGMSYMKLSRIFKMAFDFFTYALKRNSNLLKSIQYSR